MDNVKCVSLLLGRRYYNTRSQSWCNAEDASVQLHVELLSMWGQTVSMPFVIVIVGSVVRDCCGRICYAKRY